MPTRNAASRSARRSCPPPTCPPSSPVAFVHPDARLRQHAVGLRPVDKVVALVVALIKRRRTRQPVGDRLVED
eukprot:5805832-Prymnesium_polylepis.1